MKRIIELWFILLMACFGIGNVHAAYLRNIPVTVTQPDGTVLHCFASGDEFFNYLHDGNGYTIIQHPQTGYYVYAENREGKLVATEFMADRIDPASKGLQPYALISPEEWMARRKAWDVPDERPQNRDYTPNHGTLNNISIFIRFSDDGQFTNSYSSVDNMFNDVSEGAVSMRSYFRAASYGTIEIPTTFYPGHSGETIISYQDIYPRSYFQPYNASTNTNGYMYEDEKTNRELSLLARAVNYVNANYPVPTNLNIDYDDDGYVDNICFIVKGDVSGWNSLLWPHQWALYDRTVNINGKRVYTFNFQLADATDYFNTSTMCHEMNHSLGAPDLYHYSYSGPSPVGPWDLMDNNATPPQHCGAYMKMKYGHWIDEIPEITQSGTYTLNPISSSTPTNVAYKISTADPNQFYVLEYRNANTPFESALPGSGLLVYRIDTRFDGNRDYDPTNGIYDEIYIFRPNGTVSVNGDLYRAHFSSGVSRTEFSASTNPYPFFTDGTIDNNLRIYNITSAGNTISFSVQTSNSSHTITATANPSNGGTVSGGGTFNGGSTCTLTAIPAEGYAFVNWTENGNVVSTSSSFSFNVSSNRNLVAHFDLSEMSENHWTPEGTNYSGVMSVYGVIQIDGIEQYSDQLEVGAFCGDECRGVAMANEFYLTHRYLAIMTIYGEIGHQLTFKLYDHTTGQEYEPATQETITFTEDGYGNPIEPYILNFTGAVTSFHFTTAGYWSQASKWSGGALPGSNDEAFIDASCQLDMNATVNALTISDGQSLTLQSGKTLTVTNTLINTATTGLIIEDGAQLVHASENVSATVKKNITGYGTNNGRYSLISNPLASSVNPAFSSTYHLSLGNYDLYDWLPSTPDNLEWRNFKDNTFMLLPEGYGYLYANQAGVELNFSGTLKPSHYRFSKTVSYDSNDSEHPGWNLIGNPFMCNAYLVNGNNELLPYYRMNTAGNGFEAITSGAIAPMEGVFYKTSGNGVVYFTRTDFSSQIPNYTISVSANSTGGGTASGGGIYQQGQSCTVMATAATGYTFLRWTENGTQVSTSANYTFTVTDNRTLVAHFQAQTPNSYTVNVSANPSAGGTVNGGGTYNQGASCTVTATAATGYTFLRWTENGTQVSTNANYTFTVTRNRTLVAQFQVQSYNINVSANPTNGGTVSGGGSYNYGQSCSVSATAATGYTFLRWTENGTQVSTNANYTFTVTGNRTLVAQFQVQSYSINVSANPTNGGTVSGGGSYNYGQSCTVTATAATGYTFLRWTENGTQVSTNANYTCTVTGNRTLVAQFQVQGYTINVSANPSNGGTVSGSGSYNYGQSCTVTATAATGYTFLRWTENGTQVSTNANYTFTVTGNRTLVAQFQAQGYTINVSANPTNGGTVSGGGSYNYGASCIVSATANSGYTFTNWTEGGTQVSTNASYTFTVTGNRTLVANFTAQPQAPQGAINGLFSVSATQQVWFSKGNLQYQASTNTWRFADYQWDFVGSQSPTSGSPVGTVIGSDNANSSSTYSGWIDLYCWGTSGFNHGAVCYHPWQISNNSEHFFAYGSYTYNLFDQTGQADWGYNSIFEGGNQLNIWRTMTIAEWDYLINTRNTPSGIRYAKARVNGIQGLIIVPDNWNSSIWELNDTNSPGGDGSSNIISDSEWINVLENAGAVFLPVTGMRDGGNNGVVTATWRGCYWSSNRVNSPTYPLYRTNACLFTIDFYNYNVSTTGTRERRDGCAVRCVQNY